MRLLLVIMALLPLLPAGCAPTEYPPDTVLVLDGEPVSGGAIDALADALVELEPAASRNHRRRFVLLQLLFPLASARAQAAPGARELARAEAEARLGELRSSTEQAPPKATLSGNWADVGLVTWLAARELEPEAWSEVREAPGAWVLVQLLARDGNPRRELERFDVQVHEFPYLDGPPSTDPEDFRLALEIVAEDARTWRETIPMKWQYAMRGDSK